LNIPDAAHYHIWVDKNPFTAAGKVIPSDEEGVYHFTSNTLQLNLPPGRHTIILALGDNSHVRLHDPDAPAVSVDIVVVAPSTGAVMRLLSTAFSRRMSLRVW